jgi:hypothetical protein
VIAAGRRMRRRLSSGERPRSEKRQEPVMSLETAQRYAWNLACTLKVIIILIETDDGYNAMPSDDYDGDADHVVREYDVFSS